MANQVIENLKKLEAKIWKNLCIIGAGKKESKPITIEAMRQYKFQVDWFQKNAHCCFVQKEYDSLRDGLTELEKKFDAVIFAELQ